MNKIVKLSLIVLLPSLVSFVVGWKIGALQGAGVATEIQGAARSVELLSELKELRDKKYDALLKLKEMQLDTAIFTYSLYLKDRNGWIIYPLNKMYQPTLKKALIKCAKYRKNYPRKINTKKINKDTLEFLQRVDATLNKVKD